MPIRKEKKIKVVPTTTGRREGGDNHLFYSYDDSSARFVFEFKNPDDTALDLLNATPQALLILHEESGDKKVVTEDLGTISIIDGLVSFVIPDNVLGFRGKCDLYIALAFADGSSSDEVHVAFTIEESPFNKTYEEAADYYIKSFDVLLKEVELAKTNAIDEINEQLPEIKKKLSDVESRIEIADQNFNELRNDLKLSEAWAWSKDGTDRFTTVYPTENILLNTSKVTKLDHWISDVTLSKHPFYKNGTENIFRIDNPNTTENYAYTDWYPASSGEWTFSFKGFQNSALSNIDVYVFWRKEDTSQTGFIRLSGFDNFTINGLTTKESLLTLPEGTKDVYIRIDNNGSKTAGTTAELWFIEPVLRKGNMVGVPYTPAPSEDPINAYPQYRGLALLPSDLPDDYSWDLAPEYVEDNLATDVKISEITGKANKYTDNAIAAVNTNVVNIADDLAKQINSNKTAAESYADTKKTEAVNDSKKYTDEAITNITPNRTSLRIESGFSDGFTGWVTFERIGDIVIVSYALSPSTNTGTWKTPLPIASIPEEFHFNSNAYSTGSIATSNISNDVCQVGMNGQGLQFASWNRTAGIAQFAGQLTGAVKSREK